MNTVLYSIKRIVLNYFRIIKILESWVVKYLKYIHTEESMHAIIDIYDLTEKITRVKFGMEFRYWLREKRTDCIEIGYWIHVGPLSVGSPGPGGPKVCLSPLSISGGYAVWF